MRGWFWNHLSTYCNYEFSVNFPKDPRRIASKMNWIIERYFCAKLTALFCPKNELYSRGTFFAVRKEVFLFKIRFRLWIIRSTAGCVSWCMSAATTTKATVFFWMTGRNVSVSRVFPIRFMIWGPRKVVGLCGERRSSKMSKFYRLRWNERYGACDDEVPLRCPAVGQAFGNGAAVPRGIKTLRGLRPAIPPRLQPGKIL